MKPYFGPNQSQTDKPPPLPVQPMRIALVVPGGVDRSGQERVVPALLWLIERLAQRHNLHVFALHHYPEPCTYPLLGATVHDLGRVKSPPGLRLGQQWRALLAGLRAAGPFDILHGFWAVPPGLLAAAAGRRLGIPAVVSLASGELVALPEIGYGSQLTWRGRLQVGLTLRLASRITVSSQYMSGLARRYGIIPDEVPLGVDTTWFQPLINAGDGPPWRLLHVASLNKVKDQVTLLQAFQRVVIKEPRVHLDIVGEDTLSGAIQAYCTSLGLDDYVSFHGFQPSRQVQRFYQQAHLLVLPSRHDAAPVVVLEAAAYGVPTVGTAVGYVADWAPERAWAVPVGDAEALAAGILTLLCDGARRRRMGRAARAWAQAHNADWAATAFEVIYTSTLNGCVQNFRPARPG